MEQGSSKIHPANWTWASASSTYRSRVGPKFWIRIAYTDTSRLSGVGQCCCTSAWSLAATQAEIRSHLVQLRPDRCRSCTTRVIQSVKMGLRSRHLGPRSPACSDDFSHSCPPPLASLPGSSKIHPLVAEFRRGRKTASIGSSERKPCI